MSRLLLLDRERTRVAPNFFLRMTRQTIPDSILVTGVDKYL